MFNNENINRVDGLDPSMMMMAIFMGNMNNISNMNMGGNNMNNMMPHMNMGNMNNMNMFGNNMNNMNMNNMNMFGNNMNNMNMNTVNNADTTPGKITVIFTTTQGVNTTMVFDYGTTMKKVFELYLKRVDRENLIGNIDNKVYFIFNSNKMDINDNRTVENVFQFGGCRIIVNDVHNLIGA